MITEQDLQAAIAECQGQRNPTASTCMKLAAFMTIKDHMYPEKAQLQEKDTNRELSYSYAVEPEKKIETTIKYISDTDFSRAIYGKDSNDVWAVMDELMSIVQSINPRLYNSVLRKIDT